MLVTLAAIQIEVMAEAAGYAVCLGRHTCPDRRFAYYCAGVIYTSSK